MCRKGTGPEAVARIPAARDLEGRSTVNSQTSIQELRRRVSDWLIADDFAWQLLAFHFKTPCQASEEACNSNLDVSIVKPTLP
jgi:hypothetical protein